MSVICVNSTAPARRAFQSDGRLSPLHHWGYEPGPQDVALAHRLNRFEIHLRARLGGVDPRVLWHTWRHLRRGATALYLVTQPDLLRVLPWLRRRFPRARFVAWVWMDWEVERDLPFLRVCDHVLCLTPGAHARLVAAGLGAKASFVVWGADPSFYQPAAPIVADADVLIAGLTQRDHALLQAGLDAGRHRICVSTVAAKSLRLGPRADVVSLDRHDALVVALHRCAVAWIPTHATDRFPSGLTNLVEALLSGQAAVVSERTQIPSDYLAFEGVFRHRNGDAADFLRATDAALAWARQPGARARLAAAAAVRLDGTALRATVRTVLGPS